MSARKIEPRPADAISAAAVGAEIEVVVVPRGGEPEAFLIGPVAASTLELMLGEALGGEEDDD